MTSKIYELIQQHTSMSQTNSAPAHQYYFFKFFTQKDQYKRRTTSNIEYTKQLID
jgi:hypothetical protein